MPNQPERNPRKALGKGLSALLPNRAAAPAVKVQESPVEVANPNSSGLPEQFEEFSSIPLQQIRPNEEQPRDSFDADKLHELAESIRANGLIQPITVQKLGPENYRIIAGERRWRAARIAGLTTIPALVRNVEQQRVLELALIENIQREDLNPIEVATAFQRLAAEHGLSHEQIAERTGKDRSTITNFLRLLRLSPFVRNELIRGAVSVGHARALLNVTDDARQTQLCQRIVNEQLSVRETERLVKDGMPAPGVQVRPTAGNEGSSGAERLDPNVRAALDEMAMALGTKVRLVARSASAGKLEIEYYSHDDLDRIYAVIVKGS
jgi:ParB family chromosome partitioning protein